MIRSLSTFAGVSLLVAAASFTLASLIAPEPARIFPRDWPFVGDGWLLLPPWVGRDEVVATTESDSRQLIWDGSDSLTVWYPGTVTFEYAPDWSITVTAPESFLPYLDIRAGELVVNARLRGPGKGSIVTDIRGPGIRHIAVNGSSDLVLKDIDQNELSITLRGSGSVTANGQVRQLRIKVLGSGEALLSEVLAADVAVEVFGSGDVGINPQQSADIEIYGSGDVTLAATPAKLTTRIMGSGAVR